MTEPLELAQQLELILQKADRSLAAARRLVKAGDYDFASSRAYYAAFYGLQAALLVRISQPPNILPIPWFKMLLHQEKNHLR